MVIHPGSVCIGNPCLICGAKNRNPIQPAEIAAAEQAVLAEVDSLKAQLAAANAQRDELIRRAQLAVWQGLTSEKPHELIPGEPLRAQLIVLGELCGAIARAQSGQPAHHDECACEDCLQRDDEQPPIQQPAAGEPTIQSGECSFLGQLPKGPALGRFSAAERAELDDLKRKAFKAGEP